MKLISRFVVALVLTLNLIPGITRAQDNEPFKAWEMQVKSTGFGDKFSLQPANDSEYDYYVVDLTKLPSRFERIYFLNLVYRTDSVVNIDPDINDDMMWFKAYHLYNPENISCLLDEYKVRANRAEEEYSDEEKAGWLQSHDKFNSK